MQMQNIAGIVFCILCVFVTLPTATTSCTQASDCPFGSCEQGSCRCNIDCRSYDDRSTSLPVCSNLTERITSICWAFARACVTGSYIQVKVLRNISLITKGTLCDNYSDRDVRYEVEFCKNQDFCSGNGICLIKEGQRECLCDDNHQATDERCMLKTSLLSSVSNSFGPSRMESRDHPHGHIQFSRSLNQQNQQNQNNENRSGPVSSPLTQIASYVAIATVSCMLFCCYQAMKHRARDSKSSNHLVDLEGNHGNASTTNQKTFVSQNANHSCSITSLPAQLSSQDDEIMKVIHNHPPDKEINDQQQLYSRDLFIESTRNSTSDCI